MTTANHSEFLISRDPSVSTLKDAIESGAADKVTINISDVKQPSFGPDQFPNSNNDADDIAGPSSPPATGFSTVDPTSVKVPLTKIQFLLVYIGLALAIFLAALDSTIVATALDAIVNDLKQQDLLPWIGSAYLLTATSFSAL
jgi:hypothetical protein